MTSWISLVILTFHLCGVCLASLRHCPTFRASVYEHAVRLPVGSFFMTVSRKQALHNMMKNLRIYKQQAAIAASKKAHILVFPEDGIYGMLFTRQTIKPYLEYIPDPREVSWNPCTDPARFEHTEVQRYLSCMARHNTLYVVANLGDRQPCSGEQCPSDGQHQYNTDVVYDAAGNLVARYHKTNLFQEAQFDKPNKTEFVTFDAPFGRFGVFTCYDILFKNPAVDLVKRFGVRNFVFPTAWGDDLPQLSAIGFHSSFARGMGVNVLAANIHLPVFRMLGSGVYTPDGAISYYYDDGVFSDGKLIVGDVCSSYETMAENVTSVSIPRHSYSSPSRREYSERNRTRVVKLRHGNRRVKEHRNMVRDRSRMNVRRPVSYNEVITSDKHGALFKSDPHNHFSWYLYRRLAGLTSSSNHHPKTRCPRFFCQFMFTPRKRRFRHSIPSTENSFKKEFKHSIPSTEKHETLFKPIANNPLNKRSKMLTTSTTKPKKLFSSPTYKTFIWTPMKRRFGTLKSCVRETCCFLTYKIRSNQTRELFAFGIFDGYDAERYTQICTIVKCGCRSIHCCGRPTKRSRTRFQYIHLSGAFSSSYVFPQFIVSQRQGLGLEDSAWVFQNGSILSKKGHHPVVSVSLLARVYRLDKMAFR